MKNRILGIVGCVIGSALAQVILIAVLHGSSVFEDGVLLRASLFAGVLLGTVIGGIVAFVGHNRPFVATVITTIVVYAVILGSLALMSANLISTDVLRNAATVVFIGCVSGLGYRLLGGRSETAK